LTRGERRRRKNRGGRKDPVILSPLSLSSSAPTKRKNTKKGKEKEGKERGEGREGGEGGGRSLPIYHVADRSAGIWKEKELKIGSVEEGKEE